MSTQLIRTLLRTWLAIALSILCTTAPAVELLLSTTEPITIGSTTFQDEDLFVYDTVTGVATMFFDGSEEFENLTGLEDIDAVHVGANGNVVLSTVGDATIGGVQFNEGDLVEYDSTTNTLVGIVFSQSAYSVREDTNAGDILPNGNVVVSTTGPGSIPPLTFGRDDLFEYDGSTASILFNGGDSFFAVNEQVDAADVLANGNFVVSVVGLASIPGGGGTLLDVDDDDLIEFNPATGVARLLFDGDVMSDQVGIDIDAIQVEVPRLNRGN